MKKIKNFIEHQECPKINGITYTDGKIHKFDILTEWTPKIIYTIKNICTSSIYDLEEKKMLEWSDCNILNELKDCKLMVQVLVGGGDYGSDGFVAIICLNTKELKWIAFFDCSDPFEKIKIINEDIYVTSTNKSIWKFNLNNPASCVIK